MHSKRGKKDRYKRVSKVKLVVKSSKLEKKKRYRRVFGRGDKEGMKWSEKNKTHNTCVWMF